MRWSSCDPGRVPLSRYGLRGVAAAASTNVHCGLSAASPQDVSKRPTMTNLAESQKASSAARYIDYQRWPSMRR